MYKNVSQRFMDVLNGVGRTFKAKMVFEDGTEVTDGIISVHVTHDANADDFSIGDAVSSEIEVTVRNNGLEKNGVEFQLYIGLVLDYDAEEIEWVPIGVYTYDRLSTVSEVITLNAFDRISVKMSGTYMSKLEYPTDAKNVLNEISEQTGVPIDHSNLKEGIMIENNSVVSETKLSDGTTVIKKLANKLHPLDGYKHREVLSFIAQLYGMNCMCDRNGTVVFKWYTRVSSSSGTIRANRIYEDPVFGSYTFSLTGIYCEADNVRMKSGTDISVYLRNPVMTQAILDSVVGKRQGMTYKPMGINAYGNPLYDLMDVLKIIDRKGNQYLLPIMSMYQTFDGGLITEMSSTKNSEADSPTWERINTMFSDIEDNTVGARNLFRNAETLIFENYRFQTSDVEDCIYFADENGALLIDEDGYYLIDTEEVNQ